MNRPLTLRPLVLFLGVIFFLPCDLPVFAKDAPDLVQSPHLGVRLVCEPFFPGLKQSTRIGVLFQIEKGWHLYWKNPGDSGLPPSVKWLLPPGFKAGDLQWPLPEKIHIPSLTDYGYRDQMFLMAPLEVPAGLKTGSTVTLKAEVNWLVCKDICIPGKAVLSLRIPIRKGSAKVSSGDASGDASSFTSGHSNLAGPLPGDWTSKGEPNSDGFVLSFTTGSEKISNADFFPLDPNVFDNEGDPVFKEGPSSFSLKLKKSDQLLKTPSSVRGLLIVFDSKGHKGGYWIDVPLK
jgi:thiol:disulfide interchange protein DsbD